MSRKFGKVPFKDVTVGHFWLKDSKMYYICCSSHVDTLILHKWLTIFDVGLEKNRCLYFFRQQFRWTISPLQILYGVIQVQIPNYWKLSQSFTYKMRKMDHSVSVDWTRYFSKANIINSTKSLKPRHDITSIWWIKMHYRCAEWEIGWRYNEMVNRRVNASHLFAVARIDPVNVEQICWIFRWGHFANDNCRQVIFPNLQS